MPLYNKDGTVYKLDGPNPAMKDQEIWSEYTVHNMNWKSEVHKDQRPKVQLPQKKEIKTQSESFVDDLESTKSEELKTQEVEPVASPPQQVDQPVTTTSSKYESISDDVITKTFIHCLPAIIVEKKDSLYGDVSSRIQYKNKTSFEAVIINQNDMSIEMWAEVVFEKGSILYPKNGDKRWWKIQNHYPKLGGHVMQAVPSQDQPYFE
jgi:hypothetical protein